MKLRKRTVTCLVNLIAMLLLLACNQTGIAQSPPAYREAAYESDLFQEALAPYGTWVVHRTYGRVWYPNNVSSHWRPYTDGHWQYSADYGWVWVADQEWGWAPFHYGRWVFDDWYGWVWIPGRVWAPAWVYWRYGGGHAAWAPMPPTAVWRPKHGIDHRFFRHDRDLSWDSWVSIPEDRMFDRDMHRHIIDQRDNRRILQHANTTVQVTLEHDHVVNEGVPVHSIEKIIGKKVEPAKLIEVDQPTGHKGSEGNDKLNVFRPHLKPESDNDLRQETDRAETLSRQLDDQQRQRSKDEPKEDKTEPRQPGRLIDKGPQVDNPLQPGQVREEKSSPPANSVVNPPDPAMGQSPKNGQETGPAKAKASPSALFPDGQAPLSRSQVPETNPDLQDTKENPDNLGGGKGPQQDANQHGSDRPSVAPNQPTAVPSKDHPPAPVSSEKQSAPIPLATDDLPAKSGVKPGSTPQEGPVAPANASKTNEVKTQVYEQKNQQINDANQKRQNPTTQEMGNSESIPAVKKIEPPAKPQDGPQRGVPGISDQEGQQVKPSNRDPQDFSQQKNYSRRTRNDQNPIGIEQGGRQQQTPPANEVAPPPAPEPVGQNKQIEKQDRQINNNEDPSKNKKRPKKTDQQEEEDNKQQDTPQK